jgi:peptide/nickel transport system permease protein
MQQYILRRLIATVPTLIVISFSIFVLLRLIPGDTIDLMVQNYGYASTAEALREDLGYNDPLLAQYVRWMGGVLRGDLGTSLWTKRTVTRELRDRFPVTMEVAAIALVSAVLIAVPVGTLSGMRQDSVLDYLFRSLSIAGLSIPGFWLGTLVVVVPSVLWSVNVVSGYVPLWTDPLRNLKGLILPGLVLGFRLSGAQMRMLRTSVLEVARADYVRTARAKGLRSRAVVGRHVLANALLPAVTLIGLEVPQLLGGSAIIEVVFGLPGMGQLLVSSIRQRDYVMVQSLTLVFAVIAMTANLIVDLSYGLLDPRIRSRR